MPLSQNSGRPLAGQTALVTGAGSGIGRAVAVELARAGAATALMGRRGMPLRETAASIAELGGRALPLSGDVRSEEEVAFAVRSAEEELGPLSILVNNAGINLVRPVTAFTLEEWDRVVGTNLTGAFLLMRAVLPGMCRRGRGVVVNVASVSALPGLPKFPGFAAYAASKYGLVGLTETAHQEVREKGVRCVAILPGSVGTAMLKSTLPGAKPILTPGDVARTVRFLCTEEGAPLAGGPVTLMP